jgi:hypothetical protein
MILHIEDGLVIAASAGGRAIGLQGVEVMFFV